SKYYGLHTLVVMNLLKSFQHNIRFFLGIFNSTLLNYYYQITFSSSKTVFSEIGARQVRELPIPKIDFTNPAEKKKHDKIVNHVETMLELNRELQKTKSAEEQERLKQRISYTDKTIDALVYELYGLTEEEIKVVEG
ncbi:MAG: restriction endonuclease subunit M, partial [Ignavibacteria bacterium]|nr:restriction endonuclease subunit M [Ignavibacteria bacterium]